MSHPVWKPTTLANEIELLYGKSLPETARVKGTTPVYGSNGIVGYHNQAAVRGPGIVVGRKGSVGEVVFSKTDFWPIDTTYYVHNKSGHNWAYLYFLLSSLGLNTLNSHSAVPGLNRESAYALACGMPEKGEQEKIAAVLWKIQRALLTEDQLVAAARELRQSTMNQLFTFGLKSSEPVQADVCAFPGAWTKKQLSEVADITYGAQAAVANALDPSIGTPILTNVNISNEGVIDLTKLRYYKIPEHHRGRLELRKGDVLFNWRSGSADHVGKTALFDLDGDYTYSSFILRFRVRADVTNTFLFHYLHYIKSQGFFTARRNVSSINSVYNASLSATIPIYFPADKSEQHEITDILQTLARKISLHERKRAALSDLFQTLLHQLMTAQIRVDKLDIDTSEVAALNPQPA